MFEAKLKELFLKIFEVPKVSYDQPGESPEQECLFVEIEKAKNTIKGGVERSLVTGKAVLFGNADKIPFGFFSKQIKKASRVVTSEGTTNYCKDFFFYEIESNTQQFQNIIGREFSFVFFYKGQYDPAQGEITSVTMDVQFNGEEQIE